MPSSVQIPGSDVRDLAEQFGIPALSDILAARGVRLIAFGDSQVVLEPDWNAFVREAIMTAQASITSVAASRGRSEQPPGGWNPPMRRRLELNPWLSDLLEGFNAYLREHAPEIGIVQNGGGQTFRLPNGTEVGLRLKPERGGLRLTAQRSGQRHEFYVKSETDFEPAVAWMLALPAYE